MYNNQIDIRGGLTKGDLILVATWTILLLPAKNTRNLQTSTLISRCWLNNVILNDSLSKSIPQPVGMNARKHTIMSCRVIIRGRAIKVIKMDANVTKIRNLISRKTSWKFALNLLLPTDTVWKDKRRKKHEKNITITHTWGCASSWWDTFGPRITTDLSKRI